MNSDSCYGQLVPLTSKPSLAFVKALVEITESKAAFHDLSQATYDPRMSQDHWDEVLRAELARLFAWSVRRLSAGSLLSDPRVKSITSVLNLLPRYGVALHVIRRAVVFAGLEIPTVCGFPNRSQETFEMVRAIAERLALSPALSVLDCDPIDAGQCLRVENTTVVITGHRESAYNVKRSYNWRRVIGSTGRCCVVIGDDVESIWQLAGVIEQNQLEQSCARLGAVILTSSLAEDSVIKIRTGSSFNPSTRSLGEYLTDLHPSILLTPRLDVKSARSSHIGGYRLYYCDSDGRPDNPDGFGADPVFGWPGDYFV